MSGADIAEMVARLLACRGLRVAPAVSWWERLIEAWRIAERWEYLGEDGRWHRYWRRNGRVPDAAIMGARKEGK